MKTRNLMIVLVAIIASFVMSSCNNSSADDGNVTITKEQNEMLQQLLTEKRQAEEKRVQDSIAQAEEAIAEAKRVEEKRVQDSIARKSGWTDENLSFFTDKFDIIPGANDVKKAIEQYTSSWNTEYDLEGIADIARKAFGNVDRKIFDVLLISFSDDLLRYVKEHKPFIKKMKEWTGAHDKINPFSITLLEDNLNYNLAIEFKSFYEELKNETKELNSYYSDDWKEFESMIYSKFPDMFYGQDILSWVFDDWRQVQTIDSVVRKDLVEMIKIYNSSELSIVENQELAEE